MGADITVLPTAAADWEPVGSIKVLASRLSAIDIAPREVPSLVDELPMLAVCASMAEGTTRVTGAQELRVKESDRIAAIVTNLKAMGAAAGELSDGFWVTGGRKLHGTRIITMGDHRIAMAFSVAALVAEGETVLDNPQCIDVSYPGFLKQIRNLTGNSHD
jgi:3-phosphoshikimate 1-carboxyvinyltransferase